MHELSPGAIKSEGQIAERLISSPSPPQKGGEGWGEEALRVQGEMVFSFPHRSNVNRIKYQIADPHLKSHPLSPLAVAVPQDPT